MIIKSTLSPCCKYFLKIQNCIFYMSHTIPRAVPGCARYPTSLSTMLAGLFLLHFELHTIRSQRESRSLRSWDNSSNKLPSVPHDNACGIIRLTNLTAFHLSYWSLIKIWDSLYLLNSPIFSDINGA